MQPVPAVHVYILSFLFRLKSIVLAFISKLQSYRSFVEIIFHILKKFIQFIFYENKYHSSNQTQGRRRHNSVVRSPL